MVYRKSTKMPLIFHVNGTDQTGRVVTSSITSSIPFTSSSSSSSSLYIQRFAMFQNLQNAKPCGSCGGR